MPILMTATVTGLALCPWRWVVAEAGGKIEGQWPLWISAGLITSTTLQPAGAADTLIDNTASLPAQG